MRILMVDDRVPDPEFGAGFPRAHRLLLSLLELGHTVCFFPTLKESLNNLDPERLNAHGIQLCHGIESLWDIDLAVISRPHNAHYHMPTVRRYLPKARVIYDTEALWYRRYDMQLALTGRLPGWAYRYDELGLARQADLCFVVNDVEKTILETNGVRRVVRLGHALEPDVTGLPFAERSGLLVVGGILEADSSNEDGLWWYLENSWPSVKAELDCQLDITGRSHSARLLTVKDPAVNFTGHVPDLAPLYQSRRVFVATTRFATGIPWKVHEAMANGIPCVITQLLADQLGVRDGIEALVVTNPQEAAEKTCLLYRDESVWRSVRENAHDLVRRDCDPSRFMDVIATTLAELAG